MSIKKVAIIGPESTGKSTLSEQLADYFETTWVPEYAREYLQQLNRPYKEADLLKIAQGQVAAEEHQLRLADSYLFCDTTLIVVKVWSDHSFGRCDPWIAEQVSRRVYDHFLLTDIDLPWEPDPLREHPHKRGYFFDIYRKYLQSNGLPFSVISGSHEARLAKGVEAVRSMQRF